ncbi:hypothetical protein [Daejeonella sp.]|uniref:hypothetical protein n=1 Tax=Daejeonella sp. TaxID=2805397 RepID=UPI0030BDFFD3
MELRKIIRITLLIFFLAGSYRSAEGAPVQKPPVIRLDSSAIMLRTFDQPALDRYRAQKDFQYGTDYQTARSLWSRFWTWFWSLFTNVISDAASNNVTKNISLLVLAGLIIYLFIKFSGIGVLQMFSGKAKPIPLPYSESPENIHEIDFEPEIEKAIHNLDYRLAVRMLYLKCLKKLSDTGLISWQIDKTNSNYVAELVNSGKKEKFTFLTRQFEYIWYGEFNIDQPTFIEIQNDFKDFNKGL